MICQTDTQTYRFLILFLPRPPSPPPYSLSTITLLLLSQNLPLDFDLWPCLHWEILGKWKTSWLKIWQHIEVQIKSYFMTVRKNSAFSLLSLRFPASAGSTLSSICFDFMHLAGLISVLSLSNSKLSIEPVLSVHLRFCLRSPCTTVTISRFAKTCGSNLLWC